MEQKFNQIYNLGQTVTEAINKYGGMLAKISPDSASKLESVTQEVNSIFDQVTKYKGYADKIQPKITANKIGTLKIIVEMSNSNNTDSTTTYD